MNKIKISAVSYLNSKPFIYGLEKNTGLSDYLLELDVPAVCADKLLSDKVDIGLVPVAILPLLKDYTILSDYCIGAMGAVHSVMLYSDVPLNEIETILLDYQSRTSVALTRVIASRHWKINPKWIKAEKNYEGQISSNTAGVIIGDRTFGLKGKFKYAFDLAEAWLDFTGLPFVFACWVSNKKLPSTFLESFNEAIKFGVDNKEKMIEEWGLNEKYNTNVSEYLNHHISYNYDVPKQQGLKMFLNLIKENKHCKIR